MNLFKPSGKLLTKRTLTGLLISLLMLGSAIWFMAGQGVGFADVTACIERADKKWLVIYFLVLLMLQVLRLLRWGVLVRSISPLPWRRVFAVGAVGHMAIALLPMRLGETARPLLLADNRRITLAQTTATVVVERVIDGLLMSLVFVATLYGLKDWDLPREFSIGARATTLIFAGATAGLILCQLIRTQAKQLLQTLIGRISLPLAQKLIGAVDGFFNAVQLLWRIPRVGASYFLLSLLIWGLTGWSLIPVFHAFSIDLPLVVSFAILCVLVVGFMIPAGPAAAGTFNVAVLIGFGAFGVDDSVTATLALLLHVMLIANNLVVGVVGVFLGGSVPGPLLRSPAAEHHLEKE